MSSTKNFVDHRIYTIRPRGMTEFIEVFDRLAMPIQLKYLGAPVGFYMSDIGALNQVVHLWGYESIADYDQRRTARDAEPAVLGDVSFAAWTFLAAPNVRDGQHIIRALGAALVRQCESRGGFA